MECIHERIWVLLERICIKYWVELVLVAWQQEEAKLQEACYIKLWGCDISYFLSLFVGVPALLLPLLNTCQLRFTINCKFLTRELNQPWSESSLWEYWERVLPLYRPVIWQEVHKVMAYTRLVKILSNVSTLFFLFVGLRYLPIWKIGISKKKKKKKKKDFAS